MLLVAAAALLAVGAAVLLVLGWSGGDAVLAWASVVASGGALLSIAVASRAARSSRGPGPEGEPREGP